jgi:hypothetical protein
MTSFNKCLSLFFCEYFHATEQRRGQVYLENTLLQPNYPDEDIFAP